MRHGMWAATLTAGVFAAWGLPQALAQDHVDVHHDYVRHGGHVDVQHHPVYHETHHPTYYQQPQYVYPQTYYQQPVQQSQYVQPQPTPPAQPAANQMPRVRTASNMLPYQGQGVAISNPQDGSVNYTLDDAHNYTMGAGQSQKLTSKGAWIITFGRGGDLGNAKYTLTEGTYEFVVGDHGGWDIRRKAEASRTAEAPPPPAAPSAPAVNELPRTATRPG